MNDRIENGQLFIFNKDSNSFEKLGEITEAELTSTNEELETSPSEMIKQFNKAFATSFEMAIDNFNKYAFYLLIGEKYRIPNNWLKHHGRPMNRKTRKRASSIVKLIKRYQRWEKKYRKFLKGGM